MIFGEHVGRKAATNHFLLLGSAIRMNEVGHSDEERMLRKCWTLSLA